MYTYVYGQATQNDYSLVLPLYIPCMASALTTCNYSLELVYCPSHQVMIVLIKGAVEDNALPQFSLVTDIECDAYSACRIHLLSPRPEACPSSTTLVVPGSASDV